MKRPDVTILASLHLLFVLLAAGCAASREAAAPSPVGTWSYVVEGTPEGDARGVLVLTREDDGWTGQFSSDVLDQ